MTFETYPNIKLLNEINQKCIFLWFSKCKTRNVTSGYNNDNILKLEIFSNRKHKSEKNVADFKKKMLSFINLPCGHVMSHTKYGPDRFSRFDVYWIQTDRQTDKHHDKLNLYKYLSQASIHLDNKIY